MRPLTTVTLTATLASACSSTSSHVAAPRAPHVSEHASGPHADGHAQSSHDANGHAHSSHDANGHAHVFTDADTWTRVFDDPARDAWQRPDEVLRALELEPTMVVADVGAGTGYFAVRLAQAVPKGEVLATDLEPDMVRFLHARAEREQLPNLRAVQATATDLGLPARSVDRILIVNVWHHLAEREAYARDLALALRAGGRLLIVDFSLDAKRGPPASLRVAPDEVVATLERSGFSARVSPVALPEQYIVEATLAP